MSQANMTLGNVARSLFRANLNDALAALASSQSGTSRPAGIPAGGLWVNTTTATAWVVNLFDGTDDIAIGTLDTTANVFTPSIAAASLTYSKIQNVSATSRVLGRTSAGAGVIEEIPVGTAANNLVRLDGSARLPAVDGSQLTGLAGGTPTGVISPFAGSSAPSGWLLCSGGTANRTTFAALFAVIGTAYGAGDGSTTFGLPDLRGRTVAGIDNMGGTAANRITSGGSGITGTTLGASGGAETFTIGIAQMPSHSHVIPSTGTTTPPSGSASPLTGPYNTSNPLSTQGTGGGGASNVTQPTIMLNYIIKT